MTVVPIALAEQRQLGEFSSKVLMNTPHLLEVSTFKIYLICVFVVM